MLRENFIYWHWEEEVGILQRIPEPLTLCNHCDMHIPAVQLVKHRRTARYEKAEEIWIRQRDVKMAERCGKMGFRFYIREGDALVDVVSKFKTWDVPWTKRMMTGWRYDGTSSGRGGSVGYWGRFYEGKG